MRKLTELEKKARDIVKQVLDDLLGRRGFRQAWDGCDDGIRNEIRSSLRTRVKAELKKGG